MGPQDGVFDTLELGKGDLLAEQIEKCVFRFRHRPSGDIPHHAICRGDIPPLVQPFFGPADKGINTGGILRFLAKKKQQVGFELRGNLGEAKGLHGPPLMLVQGLGPGVDRLQAGYREGREFELRRDVPEKFAGDDLRHL